jgi:hypothetical protein
MKKTFYLLALAIISLVACKKDIQGVTPDQLKAILLGKDTLKMYVGEVRQISFKTTPSNYDTTSLKWSSSDTTIIAVTNLGKITAIKIGTSKISVSNKVNTVSISCLVTVVPKIDSLTVGLIAYYPFNNSAADSSGHANNGIIHNASPTTNRFGAGNSAYYFDGASGYITVGDKAELRLNNTNFSINYWVNLDEYISNSGSAVLAKNNGPFQNGWNTSITGLGNVNGDPANGRAGHAFYNVSGGGDPFAIGKLVIATGNWSMVTVLYNLTKQQVSFYINGVLDTTVSNIPTPNPNTSVDLFIGKDGFVDPSGLTPPYYIKGKLDDIRIYNRALSISEIQRLFHLTY